MKLYKVEAKTVDYDEYDSFIVWAKNPEEAMSLVRNKVTCGCSEMVTNFDSDATVTEVIKPKKSCVVLGSFNAG